MAIETERKFLVRNSEWQQQAEKSVFVRQGFLSTSPERTVRVRTTGEAAFLTVKGKTVETSRPEFEYPIPPEDAEELLRLCEGVIIEKTRHYVPHRGHVWEIDVFHGDNKGLIVAEIELTVSDEQFVRPGWIGKEISGDYRYQNSALAIKPFRHWNSQSK